MSWTPWERAWQDALYGERGFYRSTHGPAAHFATSAQGIPGGGAVLARAVVALARVHRARHILDFACGRGELLTQLSALAPDLTLTGVDVVDRPADLPQDAAWVAGPGGAQVPPGLHGLSDVLVLAHEWLDVVPCPVLQHDGRRLRVVEIDQHGVERLGAPASAADQRWCEDNWPDWDREHSRIEVGRTRDAAYAELRGSVDSGVVVTIDYGHLRDARPDGGTLMGYRDGQACAPRPDGSTDVTAHVAMDTLGAPRLVRQRDLFTKLGIRPEAADDALARTDPPAYLRSLALRSAYTALTASGGLGDFWWSVDPVSRRQDAATAASW